MKAKRRKSGWRGLTWGLAGALAILLLGDQGARTALIPGIGIDPFEVLDLQIKNNVLIVLDTSGSMKWPTNIDNFQVGPDDPSSRFFQLKEAVRAVVNANQSKVNLGLATYNVLPANKAITNAAGAGPWVYVSADANAATFYNAGFFNGVSGTFTAYDQNTSAEIFASLDNNGGGFDTPYPANCTPGAGQLTPVEPTRGTPPGSAMRCRYYMQSRLLRNHESFSWNKTLGVTTRMTAFNPNFVCPPPPAGLVGYVANPPICFEMIDVNRPAGQQNSIFYYTSATFETTSGAACGGGALLNAVAPCAGNNAPAILTAAQPEIPITAAGEFQPLIPPFTTPAKWPPPVLYQGSPVGGQFDYGDGHLDGTNDNMPVFGLRADQSTPMAGTLDFISGTTRPAGWAPSFPNAQPAIGQKNFVILLTDGDDTCADSSNLDHSAVLTAEAAERLYTAAPGPLQAETLVVAFASALTPDRVNVMAQGGSGRDILNGATTPAAALGGIPPTRPCRPGGACRNAFFAQNTQELIDVLNQAITQAASSGLFSATPSVFDAIPEYVMTVNNAATVATPPNDYSPFQPQGVPGGPDGVPPLPGGPSGRYKANAFRSYRASFEVAGFKGFVKAFCTPSTPNNPLVCDPATNTVPGWEAGQRLLSRMTPDVATTDQTFAGMFPPGNAVNKINRRIFTTTRNGVGAFSTGAPAEGLPKADLWPPQVTGALAVAPSALATAGILDEPLFRKPDGTQMVLADFQGAPFRACLGANLPATCLAPTPAATILQQAQKETREMILAFVAGAEARRDAAGNPIRNAAGQILYRQRAWVLSESTIATPAVVTPPQGPPAAPPPAVHSAEYMLYLNGPRDTAGRALNAIANGFGLRQPDDDGTTISQTDPALKPVMSVVYMPSNDMLHAFRAGPNCGRFSPPCPEVGGEELWAFVPYDLLPKLKDRLKPQSRTAHTFMMASSIRFGEVFVPGPFSLSGVNYLGRWRRIMMVGRGIGGKYYTALDITAPGPFTSTAMATTLPLVLWNRGNPDTNNGQPVTNPPLPAPPPAVLGSPNGSTSDLAAYNDMGLSWSTPVIGRVDKTQNRDREFVAYVGSGYPLNSANPDEGQRFYTLDPMTGEVLFSSLVGTQPGSLVPNALVANPVSYQPEFLIRADTPANFAGTETEAVFIGDLHGRMWKFDSNDPTIPVRILDAGIEQPIATAAALLNPGNPGGRLNRGRALVFFQTGNDNRIPDPPQVTPNQPFKAFTVDDTSPPTVVFTQDLPHNDAGKGPYRGTLQPVSAFRRGTPPTPVVFFAATRFNPITGTSCISSFDTIIFGFNALTGGTAYALQQYTGVKAIGLPRAPLPPTTGPPPVDEGVITTCATPPCDPKPALPPQDGPEGQAAVKITGTKFAQSVCTN